MNRSSVKLAWRVEKLCDTRLRMGLDPPPANKPGLIAKTVDSHSSSEVRRDDENESKRERKKERERQTENRGG